MGGKGVYVHPGVAGAPDAAGAGGAAADPAYPDTTPPDPAYPLHTREPIGPPLDGVAVPAIWSRLERALERALSDLWDGLGLFDRGRPARQVSLHYGRIAVSGYSWGRLCSVADIQPVDPARLGPDRGGLARWIDAAERIRARWLRRSLIARCEDQEAARRQVRALGERDLDELDTLEIARGPLHEPAWAELLLPWLGARLLGLDPARPRALVRAGILLEQRFAAELGRRLCSADILSSPDDVAYLTVAERLRAVHEKSPLWSELIAERRRRVDAFVEIDVPLEFWGRPRVESDKLQS